MDTVTFKEVGANILNTLQSKDLTQQMLADRLGISKQVMSKIINGTKAINVLEIKQIAKSLEISVDSLLRPSALTQPIEAFNYMGKLNNVSTQKKIEHVNKVIEEIIFLESIIEAP